MYSSVLLLFYILFFLSIFLPSHLEMLFYLSLFIILYAPLDFRFFWWQHVTLSVLLLLLMHFHNLFSSCSLFNAFLVRSFSVLILFHFLPHILSTFGPYKAADEAIGTSLVLSSVVCLCFSMLTFLFFRKLSWF